MEVIMKKLFMFLALALSMKATDVFAAGRKRGATESLESEKSVQRQRVDDPGHANEENKGCWSTFFSRHFSSSSPSTALVPVDPRSMQALLNHSSDDIFKTRVVPYLNGNDIANFRLVSKEMQNFSWRHNHLLSVSDLHQAMTRIRREQQFLTGLNIRGLGAAADPAQFLYLCCQFKVLSLAGLAGGARVMAAALATLPDGAVPALEELDLSGTGATLAEITAILTRCPNLRKLSVRDFALGAALATLPEGVGLNLEELSLPDDLNGAIEALITRFTRLKNIRFFSSYHYNYFVQTALHLAAGRGQTETIQALLNRDADVHAQDQNRWTALHCAADNGQTATVRALLARDANVLAGDNNRFTALHFAARNGHTETVRALLEAGANVLAVDQNGLALHLAALYGHTAIVEALLDAGADVNAGPIGGNTALHLAAARGHKDTVQFLLSRRADVKKTASSSFGNRTALHGAVGNGHTATVEILLRAGASVNAATASGTTALHGAAGNGHTEIVRALLDAGANVHAANASGWTALHGAAFHGHTATVLALLNAPGINRNNVADVLHNPRLTNAGIRTMLQGHLDPPAPQWCVIS